ncbi:FAS1-like dehydratase domain-containing protein [Paraburkholderia sp. HP33-1]|uniref:FAS1-like dehydratase domain-containing protein n=1 Tax=Paraburkholderia sp. HP33-1 TaxID=2883243 RepID=UPI001F324655|nr:MaoC family dehydratase N-terminal domain-containing protein [Paraburkholderia sp. HP33-1]
MAERGVYTAAEQKMLADFKERSAQLTGWIGETPAEGFPYPAHRIATRELIEHMASAADFRNPLYRDEAYARNTRWGGIVAPPFYYHAILHGGGICPLFIPPEEGIVRMELSLMAHKTDFYKHIRLGDYFRIWYGPSQLVDITRPGKDSLRQFMSTRVISYINQNDEVVCSDTDYHYYTILPPAENRGPEKFSIMESLPPMPGMTMDLEYTEEYRYTKEDIAVIDRLYNAEMRRGGKTLFWEDVNVGDELPPVVMGPLTTWDSVVALQGFGAACVTMNDLRQMNADTVIIDRKTHVPVMDIEFHLTDQGAKRFHSYSTTPIGPPILHFFARLITNWAGDDGYLRRLTWRNFANTAFGDTVFGRAKVTRKFVEDGEHMVELDVWMESIRGYVSNVGPSIVSLLAREETIACNKSPAFRAASLVESDARAAGIQAEACSSGIQIGDRIRIKDRPDWPMPGGYRLANQTATVHDVVDYSRGYVLARLDEKATGIDVRVPLGFRSDSIEKI